MRSLLVGVAVGLTAVLTAGSVARPSAQEQLVPDDAPVGIVRYTITAKDPHGRTGEFKPFEVPASQLTIIE